MEVHNYFVLVYHIKSPLKYIEVCGFHMTKSENVQCVAILFQATVDEYTFSLCFLLLPDTSHDHRDLRETPS